LRCSGLDPVAKQAIFSAACEAVPLDGRNRFGMRGRGKTQTFVILSEAMNLSLFVFLY
jgi:hypothetical protein